jgi:hypothetical protein
MYGPDADKLFSAVKPVLETASFMKSAKVVLRYGSAMEPNVRETEVVLAPQPGVPFIRSKDSPCSM